MSVPFERLPSGVRPITYDITLRPNLKELTFNGFEVINIEINEETERIVLNSLQIHISFATFTPNNGKTLKPIDISLSADRETASLIFSEPLSAGTGDLKIGFTGTLNDKLKGFYRSKYLSADGQRERYAAATHFEATAARLAFPCWDEPALKATFDVTLVVPTNLTALSNMNVITEKVAEDDPDLKEVKFATTPVMSTYLLAFFVGETDFVEDMTPNGVTIRVYTPVGKKELGLFALNVAVKAIPYYEEYFGIAYPLPKLDLIALADFAIGAMENWGLITYKEVCLLVDPQHTSIRTKQNVALVVTHELAHMWFGNLVTMEWWTDLWLKEGFATFIEYLCVDHLFSEYEIWSQFVSDTYLTALELDALHNSHPIEVPVGDPSEISEIFDAISYNKGAAVIRVLHQFIGDEDFRKGLNEYLKQNSYKNTTTEHLWTALEEASNKPVALVMSTWTKQKGFPIISVTSRSEGKSRILSLTQRKYCADGKIPEKESTVLWMIPVLVSRGQSAGEVAVEALMDSKTLELVIPNVSDKEWVKLNPNSVGLYRVQYSAELLSLLLPAISDKTLPPLDRLSLQSDSFASVKSGQSSTADVLKLMEAFIDEDNCAVWNSINDCLVELDILLSNTDIQTLFHTYGCHLFSKVYSRLGWQPIKGETHFDTLLRSLVISRLASFEDKEILSKAKALFVAHSKGTDVIPVDLRGPVYKAVAIDGDDKTFNDMFKLYREANLSEEKIRICGALGCVKDVNKKQKVLEFALSKEVRSQDSVVVIISVANSKTGRDLVWQFFQKNNKEFRRRYETTVRGPQLVKNITQNFASEEKAQEVEKFFTQNPFIGAERTIRQSIETIRSNSQWLTRDLPSIRSYLSNRL